MIIHTENLLSEPIDLDDNVFLWDESQIVSEEVNFSEQYSVLRNNIVTSPVVQKIYRLKYNINKQLNGLESYSSENDGSILTPDMNKDLLQKPQDSYDMDDFDLESEMLKYISNDINDKKQKPIEIDLDEAYEPELEEIFITIQQNSIKVNNRTSFNLPSSIRATNILRGSKLQELYDEDSLLVSLTSGFLLLIRFYNDSNQVKPYVVQWWRLEINKNHLPKLTDIGKDILTHDSGMGFASTAVHGNIRLFYCGQSQNGVKIDKIHNLVIDGTIIHSCFLEPFKDANSEGHAFLFNLVVTSHGRYLIRLFEWWIEESRVMDHTPMVLANDFGVPIFIIPILDGVLLVMEDRLIRISLKQILSADYSFFSIPFPGSFPVNFCIPNSPIFSDNSNNEVLISTENGIIYSIILLEKEIKISPVLKITKLAQFVLERNEDGFQLLYSSDMGSGGYLIFPTLDRSIDVEQRDVLKNSEVIQRWSSWAPIFDIEVIDTKHKTQDLWLAHGKSISRLKYGLSAEKEINDSKLRKAYKVFHHIVNGELYFIFSFIDKTLIFKYDQEELIAISDSGLDMIARTIALVSLDGVCFQITEDSIVISNFQTDQVMRTDLNGDIILADCYANLIVVIADAPGMNSSIMLSFYEVSGNIREVQSFELQFQPNIVKLMNYNGKIFLLIASESNIIIYAKEDDEFLMVNKCGLSITEPHDLVAFNNVVYLSSRYGEYIIYDLSEENGLTLREKNKMKLTDAPIDFFLTEKFILLISKNVWKLPFSTSIPLPIVFQEARNRSVFSAIALDDSVLAVLRTDGFSIVTVETTQGLILKTIKVGQVVKKLKYISHLGAFAMITESSLIFTNKLNKLEERLYSKKKSSTLFENEIPLSLSEWILPFTDKSYRNLLVGCSTDTGGSLKILQPKYNQDDPNIIEVYELFNLKTEGPVLSTGQLDESTILYSSGYDLFTSIYDIEEKKMLEPVRVFTFTSIIMNFDIKGDEILVSTKDYSVTKLLRGVDMFYIVEDDHGLRKITNSLFMANNVTVTTDKLQCTISGIQNQNNRFKAYVPFIPKLKECKFLPKWYQPNDLLRFIAYGVGGDIQIYTILNKKQTDQYKKLYEYQNDFKKVTNVTEKGLWEIDKGPWGDNRCINILESTRFNFNIDNNDQGLDDETERLKQLLSAISI